MWNMTSLDGYFTDGDGGLNFMQYAWGPELEAFINRQAEQFGTIIFGRKTYEGMASYWSDKDDFVGRIMNRTPKLVFSRTLPRADWQNSRLVSGPLRPAIEELKRNSTQDAFILGSGELCNHLAKENLIDEYRIGMVSIALGKGNRLFSPALGQLPLELIESKPLGPRTVLLRYRPSPRTP